MNTIGRMRWAIVILLVSDTLILVGKLAEGYRLGPSPAWLGVLAEWLLMGQLLALPCVLTWLLVSVILNVSRNSLRIFVILIILAGSLFVVGIRGGAAAYKLGRQRFEAEIGLEDLAKEGIQLIQAYKGKNAPHPREVVLDDFPRIARLKPSWVSISALEPGRLSAQMELHGGFDHYGYEVTNDEGRRVWVLEWYTEGFHQELVTIPF